MTSLEISNYLRNKILDHTLGSGSYAKPSALYLALYTSDPTVSDVGTEVSGSGYARQAVTFGTPAAGIIQNTSAHTFTASGSWGTVSHAAIRDASSGGNLLFFTPLDSSLLVTGSGIYTGISFSVGSITAEFPDSVA